MSDTRSDITSARPNPILRTTGEVTLFGTMTSYASQADASEGIPHQWRGFLENHPTLKTSSSLCGASPCTADHRIHYLTGIASENPIPKSIPDCDSLTLAAGEYAVVQVNDAASLRDTWIWLLSHWLPNSGRREKNAPEFECYTSISDAGTPVGPVEIWIPLEPLT